LIDIHHPDLLLDPIEELAKEARVFVAITGAPGAGKSTLTSALCEHFNTGLEEPIAVVVPMDGYHLDNNILQQRGLLDRKGAPFTFDAIALASDLERILDNERVYVPVFDRDLDCSRAFAREVHPSHQIILVEGNYLCCNEEPWQQLGGGFDLHIHINAERDILEQRLLQRWADQGMSAEDARARVDANDMLNVDWVLEHSDDPDILYWPLDE